MTKAKTPKPVGPSTMTLSLRSKPIAGYKVIYGIMRHPYQRSKQLGLPFFSKVSLRAATGRLQLMG